MEWEHLSQADLHKLRDAAEQAWGYDTCHRAYRGHPNPAAGQCLVTSEWLKGKLGGYVGAKEGHYFWVSPDKTHIIDLTGDKTASPPENVAHAGIKQDDEDEGWVPHPEQLKWRPGPVLFKKSDHPLYEGFHIVKESAGQRAKTFAQRADAILEGKPILKIALDYMGEGHPMDEPQAIEDADNRYQHDEVDHEPHSGLYNYVYANGKLQVSPDHDHRALFAHGGVPDPDSHSGPMAVGEVNVVDGSAQWTITSNVGLRGLARILRDYSSQVGWRWGGMTNTSGNIISDDFEPKTTMWYRQTDGELKISPHPVTRDWHTISIQGKTARVNDPSLEGLQEWADDFGYRLAEYPGGGDMNDRIRNYAPAGEDYETYNMGDPSPVAVQSDDDRPTSMFKCKNCGALFGSFQTLVRHQRTEQPMINEEVQDGHFPQIDDEQPAAHYHEWPRPEINPVATVLRVASYKEAARVQGFETYARLWGYDNDETKHYVAYQGGEPLGYASVRDTGEVVMVQVATEGRGIATRLAGALQRDYDELWTHAASPRGERLAKRMGLVCTGDQLYKWSASTQPKDMIDKPIPFIYDINSDNIAVGSPGSRHSDIQGTFTPGGIVEGTYEPGGHVVFRSMTDVPYSLRHVLDLWYWSHPNMKIVKVDMKDNAGNVTKLAGLTLSQEHDQSVGSYIKTMAATDPAVWTAYRALHKAGGQVYVVGGAVRDALMQKEPKDIDLMVSGLPPGQVHSVLDQLPGRVDLTGKDFGVFRYRTKGREVEIALPRTERSTGPRRVDFKTSVDHTLSVEADLHRRDFTANAMAVDLDKGQLIDPHSGAQDIANGRLDTVHENSFQEDPTRLLRALAVSSRHGLAPSGKTRKEMTQNASRLDDESRERIQAELDKIFASSNPAGAMRTAQETGLLKHIFPEVSSHFDYDQNNPHHAQNLGVHLLHVLGNVSQASDDPDLRLAGLLHDIGKPQSAWVDPQTGFNHYYRGVGQGDDHETVGAQDAAARLQALKYPKARIDRVSQLISHHMFPAFSSSKGARRFLNRVGDHADDLLILRQADQYGKGTDEYQDTKIHPDAMRELVGEVRAANEPTKQADLAINGNDIVGLGVSGPQVGEILRSLSLSVVDDPSLNTRDSLLNLARQHINSSGSEL